MHARIRLVAALTGFGAVAIAIGMNIGAEARPTAVVAAGSGDSPTTGQYTSPVVPAMSINPTAMKLGATATFTPPAATMATSEASPTYKASPVPGCTDNGHCP